MRKKLHWKYLIGGFALLAICFAALNSLRYDLRAYSLLTRFVDPRASGFLSDLETHQFSAQELSIPTPSGSVPGRLYLPAGIAHPPGMVVVHGIHHLGIDEPRLMSFARAASSTGYAVLTPEVQALADYHVDAASIATIGESAKWLSQHLGTGSVTVVGVSFAGGLSLLAACDPQYAPHIRSLLLMGAYDSLERVARFLATSQAELPDGKWEPYKAHDYGAAVFVYSHLDQFFLVRDRDIAHQALRDWLWERPQQAQPLLLQLSDEGRELMQLLMARQIDRVRPAMLAAIQEDRGQLAEISPEGKLSNLRVPVYVLHGATDDIIPSTESRWLEKDIPPRELRAALITPAFSHVDPEKRASVVDELRLVNFLTQVLRSAN